MVRKIIPATLLAVVLLVTSVHADILSEGKKRAREEDKSMVVYFFSRYCTYCEAMERDVLADKDIGTILNRDMIYLKIDVDGNEAIARRNGVWGYPTTILMENTGKPIVKIPGYIPKKDFKAILAYAKGKHYKVMGLGEYLKSSQSR